MDHCVELNGPSMPLQIQCPRKRTGAEGKPGFFMTIYKQGCEPWSPESRLNPRPPCRDRSSLEFAGESSATSTVSAIQNLIARVRKSSEALLRWLILPRLEDRGKVSVMWRGVFAC
jgi:hypothetical protein